MIWRTPNRSAPPPADALRWFFGQHEVKEPRHDLLIDASSFTATINTEPLNTFEFHWYTRGTNAFEDQWEDLAAYLLLPPGLADIDADGLPESLSLRLAAAILSANRDSHYSGLYDVYELNLLALEGEPDLTLPYRGVLAAL